MRRERQAERDAGIVSDVLAGESMRAVARKYGIDERSVRRIIRRDVPMLEASGRSSGRVRREPIR